MKYFTKQEMIRCFREYKSDRCAECRLTQAVKQLSDGIEDNIEALVNNVLDPLREKYGKSIKVNSGYRCPRHNEEVLGARNSQHMKGEAADICAEQSGYANMTAWRGANMEIARLIVKNGRFDQLILENVGENDLLPAWVHVSFSKKFNRGQVLKKVAGKAGYPALTTSEICQLLGGGFRGEGL